jgi:nucleoside-diphosphate-sugar epimerase
MSFWQGRRVLVTGGASFIGSHLTDALLARGAKVRIVDDLTSGHLGNIQGHLAKGAVELLHADLREPGICRAAVKDIQCVFHLAADHGGRGYVDLHQAGPATNFFLDGQVFWEARRAGVEKIVFASSGCVYPGFLQSDPQKEVYLTEDVVKPPYDADNLYGWAKLMAELTLRAYHREHGMKTASCRFFTVYGPRGVENHAVIAMIAKAFTRQDPFEVWGDGNQIRNWTYIDDIVRGTVLAGEKIDDGTAVNLGTMERVRVIDAVKMVCEHLGHRPQIKLRPDMPTGPLNRVADNALARKLLGWEPQVTFADGLKRTLDWYVATKDPAEVRRTLERMLTER